MYVCECSLAICSFCKIINPFFSVFAVVPYLLLADVVCAPKKASHCEEGQCYSLKLAGQNTTSKNCFEPWFALGIPL